MNSTATLPAQPFSCLGVPFETGPGAFGELRDSNSLLKDPAALRQRMQEDGYLLCRGLLDRDDVLAARREVTRRLAEQGYLLAGTDPMDAIASHPDRSQAEDRHGYSTVSSTKDLTTQALRKDSLNPVAQIAVENNEALVKILYEGPMIAFFEHLIGEAVRHYDFTWFRSIFPASHGTTPHSDVVYMGRGERDRLFTAWTPIGDIDYEQGGLVILEGSNNHAGLRDSYWKRDVDAYCTNREDKRDEWAKGLDGTLAKDVKRIRNSVGGRWLTSEFQAGDVLIFTCYTVHCSLDNHSDRIRLSSDSRYQPASKPADDRWIGASPIGHGPSAKRGLVC